MSKIVKKVIYSVSIFIVVLGILLLILNRDDSALSMSVDEFQKQKFEISQNAVMGFKYLLGIRVSAGW